MNASNSSGEAKWIACPDTTCSTRPARRPWATFGFGVHLHQKGALRRQGVDRLCWQFHMHLASCYRVECSRRQNPTPGQSGKSSGRAQVSLRFLSGGCPTDRGWSDGRGVAGGLGQRMCVAWGSDGPPAPKVFAVLRLLVAQAGQLVTKEALLEAVWPETVVSDAVLTSCIGELRKVLGETAQAPRFIQTVHRRGYRFIGHLPLSPRPPSHRRLLSPRRCPPPLLVGRERELTHLHQWLERVRQGARQTVFLTGEPGLGKTTVVNAFVEDAAGAGMCGWRAGSVSSTTARAKPTCRSWRRWAGCVENLRARRSCRCWNSRPPRGWPRCPRCSARRRSRRCSAGSWGHPAAHVAGVGRGGRGADGQPPAPAGAGGSALGRLCHAGPADVSGPPARTLPAAHSGDLSARRGAAAWASLADGQTGIGAARPGGGTAPGVAHGRGRRAVSGAPVRRWGGPLAPPVRTARAAHVPAHGRSSALHGDDCRASAPPWGAPGGGRAVGGAARGRRGGPGSAGEHARR